MAHGPCTIDPRSLIPDSVSAVLLPTKDTFVASLLKFTIPFSRSSYNVSYSVNTPHDTDEVTWQIHDIISIIGLPSANTLLNLHACTPYPHLSNMQSIIIPIYPAVRFPLWLATLLSKLSSLHTCRCDWSRAWTWIGQLEAANDAPLGHALEKVHETLAMLPIDGRIDGVMTPGALTSEGIHKFLPAMTLTASTWLGEGWLSDSNIDAIIRLINKSAEN